MSKCIVIATKQQLESVGIDRELTGVEVDYISDFGDSYYLVEVDAPDYIVKILGNKAKKEQYDIPKYWLKFKEYEK